MEQLLEILSEIKPDIDFNSEKALIDNEIFDSFDIVQLIAEISEKCEIEIKPHQIIPDYFDSIETMWYLHM